MYELLEKIDSPEDIRHLDIAQLRLLCSEIRDYMVECCAVNPGHLGSSLGAVELIVGLHYVFDTPKDKLVFDVSHQTYAHKILTGRREAFRHLRCKDGLSGFTRMDESEFDAFGGGHASTSISAALGLAKASAALNTGSKTVALIGDGALSGGLAYEGLNNAEGTDILVILNDNNMSIDRNIGAMHRYLLKLTTAPLYNSVKKKIWDILGEGRFRNRIQNIVLRKKSGLVQHTGGDLFEALGFRYFGPVNGNDIEDVVKALQRLKNLKGPRILHTITTKGKGYAPAEVEQTIWHAPGHFDPETGKRISGCHKICRYQDVFGEVLLQLARMDQRIVGITPAMASGCGMNILAENMPERFYDVGIAEEHAVTFSAGLAAGGMKPFCNIYSSFAQRSFDQLIHDTALQKLPVVLCLDRAGLVGEDGPTHHGVFDMASSRSIPGCIVAAPANELELKNMMFTASGWKEGPFIIRYPRGAGEGVQWRESEYKVLPVGKGEKLISGCSLAIVALGPAVNRAAEAVRAMAEADDATASELPTVWNARFLKPFDPEIADDLFSGKYTDIITIEDGSIKGGLFSEIAELASLRGNSVRIHPIGVPDRFIHHGTQNDLRDECGLTKDKILEKVLDVYK